MTVGPAEFFSFRERDLDGAKAAVGQDFFTTSMDLLDRTTSYDFRFDGVVLGALAVGMAQISSGLEEATVIGPASPARVVEIAARRVCSSSARAA